jgi:starvation-inducible DNA-binding protein
MTEKLDTPLIEKTKVLLATVFSFYMKTHNYHFNVVGPNFPQYHKFLNDLYDDVWESFDDIGEQIRQLDSFVPVSYSRFSELSLVKSETSVQKDTNKIFSILVSDNNTVIDILRQVYEMAEKEEEYGLSNFIQDRIQAHKKHGWMMKSILGKNND